MVGYVQRAGADVAAQGVGQIADPFVAALVEAGAFLGIDLEGDNADVLAEDLPIGLDSAARADICDDQGRVAEDAAPDEERRHPGRVIDVKVGHEKSVLCGLA